MCRKIKRNIATKATVGHFIETTVPTILGELRRDCLFGYVVREHDNQVKRIELGHIHRDILNAAIELIRFPENYHITRNKLNRGWSEIYYVNSNKGLYEPYTKSNRVTLERIKLFRTFVPGLSVEDFDMRHLSMYRVDVNRKNKQHNGQVIGFRCQCPNYWSNGTLCSHIVAVAHLVDVLNVKQQSSALMPVRGRGRPKSCEKALQRDLNPDILAQQPAIWRGSNIRHTIYLTGCVVDYRHTPDDVVMWQCRFPDAPTKKKEYDFDKHELHHALGLYKVWLTETRQMS